MTNYVKMTGVDAEKTIFDFKKPKTPPPTLTPTPYKKKTLPISEEGQSSTQLNQGKRRRNKVLLIKFAMLSTSF